MNRRRAGGAPDRLVWLLMAAAAAFTACGDDDDLNGTRTPSVDAPDRADTGAAERRADRPPEAERPPPSRDPTGQAATIPAFRDYDGDGDGALAGGEFASWVGREGVHASWAYETGGELDSDGVAGRLFRFWDADQDSLVSEAEWRSGLRMWYGPEDTGRFVDWDGDGNLGLDATEMSEALRARGMYSSIDSDGDSVVSREELAGWLFHVLDTSGNGYIEVQEWKVAEAEGWVG